MSPINVFVLIMSWGHGTYHSVDSVYLTEAQCIEVKANHIFTRKDYGLTLNCVTPDVAKFLITRR